MTETYTNRQLLAMIGKIERSFGGERIRTWGDKVRRRLNAVPMADILGEVPGDSVIEKAEKIGVSRQTFYYWNNGVTRPNKKWAKRISTITGYEIDVIRGLDA